MKLADIEKTWEVDSKIDLSDLAHSLLEIPTLHNKWWKIYNEEKREFKSYEYELVRIKNRKRDYFEGRLGKDDLKKEKWDQFNHRINKNYTSEYIQADEDVLKIDKLCSIQKMKMDMIEDIIKMIHSRRSIIYSIQEFLNFKNGSR